MTHYLSARVGSFARASLRLIRFGFYDEALALVRSVGEIANLLCLFEAEPASLDAWKTSERYARLRDFSPARVRRRLQNAKRPAPMDEDRYQRLCELVTHPTPEIRPQSFNVHGKPLSGSTFQEAGVLIALNELAAVVAVSTLTAAQLIAPGSARVTYITKASMDLLRSLGGLSVVTMNDIFEELRSGGQDSEESEHVT